MELDKYGAVVRLLVDHPDQVHFLEEYEKQQEKPQRLSIFIKVNGGQKYSLFIDLKILNLKLFYLSRAGVVPGSQEFSSLLKIVLSSQTCILFGFTVMLVTHTGQLHYPRHQRSYQEKSSL